MNPPKNTQSLFNKVDLLVNKAEGDAITLNQQQLMDLKEDELTELKTKIEQSQMESVKKQETLIIIRNQQELLRLKTQLPDVPKSATDNQSTASEEAHNPAEPKSAPVQKVFWNPTTWTPEERTKAATIAGIGVAVVGGLIMLHALTKKLSGAAQTVSENAKSSWGVLKFLGIATAVTAAGYFGWNAFSKFKKSVDDVTSLLKKAKELEETARNAPEAIRQEMEKKAQEFRQMADELREGKTKEDTPVPAPVATKEPTSTQKTVETVKETGKDIFIAKAILSSTNNSEWTAANDTKERQVNGLLLLNDTIKMDDILNLPDTADASSLYAMPESDVESRSQGAKVLTDFCKTHENTVVDYIMRYEKMEKGDAMKKARTLSLKEYVQHAIMGGDTVAEIVNTLGNGTESLEEKFKKLNMQSIVQGNMMLRHELHDFIVDKVDELGLDLEKVQEIDLQSLLRAILTHTSTATVADHIALGRKNPPTALEDKIIQNIFEELEEHNTHLYMLPCFHGIFPNNVGKNETDRMKIYIMDHMSPAQALRIYLYRRMMDAGNPAGLVLMQADILKFIAEQDDSFFGHKKHEVMFTIAQKMLTATGTELADEWKKLNIDVNAYPELFDQAAASFNTIAKVGTNVVTKSAKEWTGFFYAAVITAPVAITAAGFTKLELERMKIMYKTNPEHIREMLQTWASGAQRPNWVTQGEDLVRIATLGASADDIVNTSHAFDNLYNAIHNVGTGDPARKILLKSFEKCLQSPHSITNWDDLYKELRAARLYSAANAAEDFAKSHKMRVVFNYSRFSFGKTVLSRMKGGTMRGYELVRGKTVELAKEGASLLYNSKFFREALAKSGDGAEALLRLIQSTNMPTWLADAFAKSARGVEMLFNAARTGGAPALQYLVKLGSYAKVAGKIAVGATVGIDVIICAVEMAANKARMEQEDNPAIKELFAMRDKISITNAAVGTAFSGTLLASTWAPAAAPFATMLALPLAGIFVTKYAHDELEAVSATWLGEEKDWAEKDSGSLLNNLDKLGPGKVTFWQNLAAGNSRIETFHRWDTMSKEEFAAWQKHALELPEEANEGQRFLATRAYLAQNTDMYPQQGETREAFQERFAEYQRLQMAYLGKITQDAFDSKYMDSYRNAASHAELITLSKTLKAAGQSQIIDVNGKEFDLAQYADLSKEQKKGSEQAMIIGAYQKQSRAVTLMQLSVLKQMESSTNATTDIQDQILQSALLQEVRHDINACEKNMQNADFTGWKMTGYEEQTRDIARFVMNNALRILIREQADKLRTMDTASVENFESSVQTIRAFLQRDPVSFEAEAKNYNDQGVSGLKDALEKATNELRAQTGNKDVTAGTSIFSDFGYIRSHLYLHPPVRNVGSTDLANGDFGGGDFDADPLLAESGDTGGGDF